MRPTFAPAPALALGKLTCLSRKFVFTMGQPYCSFPLDRPSREPRMPGPWKMAQLLTRAPKLADAKRARARLADLMRDERAIEANLGDLEKMPTAQDLLLGIADHSSFLWDIDSRDPAGLAALMAGEPDVIFA